MIQEYIKAFLLIFLAEMGDKTQILAIAFATRFGVLQVLSGVFLGSLLNHGVAVVVGAYLAATLPLEWIRLAASVVFIAFGLWSLRGEQEEDDEEPVNVRFGPVLTVATAFFIGELGDKTQLAAITLSSGSAYPVFILAGTVSGMVVTGGFGILIGRKLGKRVPELVLKIVAALVFLFFGLVGLWETVPNEYLTSVNILLFIAGLAGLTGYLVIKRLRDPRTPLKKASERLFIQLNQLEKIVNDTCLGEDFCKHCQGRYCPIGYSKLVLAEALKSQNLEAVLNAHLNTDNLRKPFRDENLRQIRQLLDKLCAQCDHKDCDRNCVVHRLKRALEKIE